MANTNSLDLESGSTQYCSAADSASLSITGNGTWEAWIKPESMTGTMTLFSKWRDSGTQKSYGFDMDTSGNIIAYLSSGGTTYTGGTITLSSAITTATWQHIAIVYTAASGKVEVFKNGVSGGSNSTFPTSIFDSTETFALGRDWTYGQYYDGLIDEVRVWASARTGANILADYQTQLTGSETNLKAYWKLDNAYTDSTANANTLTAVNTPVFSTDTPFSGASSKLGLLGVG
jgi:hypothetical protein